MVPQQDCFPWRAPYKGMDCEGLSISASSQLHFLGGAHCSPSADLIMCSSTWNHHHSKIGQTETVTLSRECKDSENQQGTRREIFLAMEAVLARATIATAGGAMQAQAGAHGVQMRAVLADRINISVPQVPHHSVILQTDVSGPLSNLWKCNNDEKYRIWEEAIEENNNGPTMSSRTLDGSVAGSKVQEQRVDDKTRVVAHTRESFTKFLRHFPAAELKDVAQACYLSNLAYIISEIKEDELQKDHHLRFVTSSTQIENSGATVDQIRKMMAPATAYALAATASYLQSRNDLSSTTKTSPSSEVLSTVVDHQLSSAVTSFMEASETCPEAEIFDGNTGVEEFSTPNSSACGWFVCDDPTTYTRIFSIQGSESMASWKANLRFQPTYFEDSTSGAVVHLGVYEIAKSLYEQMQPWVRSHMAAHGKRARISFTGHSLGGSLAALLSLMFQCRGEVPVSALRPVYTFGAPSVINGGNRLLKRLGFPPNHIQSIVISRDLVPRIFACDVPEQIAVVLKRINPNFRNQPCFANQKHLYDTTGQLVILQPEAQQAPGHPLLPSGSGLYIIELPATAESQDLNTANLSVAKEVQAAELYFLNSPHPLDIMSDPSAYGSEGAISRDHDPRSYRKAVNQVLKQTVQGLQQRRKRMQLQLRFNDENAQNFPTPICPPSPLDTPKRSKIMTDSISVFFNNHSFSRAPSAGVCNYLSLGSRNSLHTKQLRFSGSYCLESFGSRYGNSVVSRQH